jgi:hypothetical protein
MSTLKSNLKNEQLENWHLENWRLEMGNLNTGNLKNCLSHRRDSENTKLLQLLLKCKISNVRDF